MEGITIKVGDYIRSDWFSPIQGQVVCEGTFGSNIPCYQIKLPTGQIEYIIKGQAILLWTKEDYEEAISLGNMTIGRWARHD